MFCSIAGNFEAVTAVICQHLRVTLWCYPLTPYIFAVLPAQKFWRETVSLLDVIWPQSNQWGHALLGRNFQLYNKDFCSKGCFLIRISLTTQFPKAHRQAVHFSVFWKAGQGQIDQFILQTGLHKTDPKQTDHDHDWLYVMEFKVPITPKTFLCLKKLFIFFWVEWRKNYSFRLKLRFFMNFRSCKKSHYFKTWPSSKTIVGVLDLAQFVTSFQAIDSLLTSGTALLRKFVCVVFGCRNVPNPKEGIALHPISFYGKENPQ